MSRTISSVCAVVFCSFCAASDDSLNWTMTPSPVDSRIPAREMRPHLVIAPFLSLKSLTRPKTPNAPVSTMDEALNPVTKSIVNRHLRHVNLLTQYHCRLLSGGRFWGQEIAYAKGNSSWSVIGSRADTHDWSAIRGAESE